MAVDKRSEKHIATLAPEVQPLARKLIETAVAQGINAKVISGSISFINIAATFTICAVCGSG